MLVLTLIVGMFTSCNKDDDSKPKSIFGYYFLKIISMSMEPLIEEGDIIIVKEVDPNTIQVGDVIAFFDPASTSGSILTHRVIDIYEEDGRRYATTAGDFNANDAYEKALLLAKNLNENSEAEVQKVLDKATIISDSNKPGYEYVIYEGHRDSKPVELNNQNIIGIYSYNKIPSIKNLFSKISIDSFIANSF